MQTLADIFLQQEEERRTAKEPATSRRPPAVYRCYQGGECLNCGKWLGVIETDGGRDRLYCDNNGKCKTAYHRKRKRERAQEEKRQQERAQTVQASDDLRRFWQRNGIYGETLDRLQEILVIYGRPAAWAATNAVLVALATQERAGANEQATLIDEILGEGEALGFEEVTLLEFRIPAGLENWLEFANTSSITLLRQLRGYLYDRQHQRERQALARKKLETLSHNVTQ